MSSKLPHRHVCTECKVLIANECECSDTHVLFGLCDECHIIYEEGEGELEF